MYRAVLLGSKGEHVATLRSNTIEQAQKYYEDHHVAHYLLVLDDRSKSVVLAGEFCEPRKTYAYTLPGPAEHRSARFQPGSYLDRHETPHTPLPWLQDVLMVVSAQDPKGRGVTHTGLLGRYDRCEADAEFIVRSANAHYQLVDACRQLLAVVQQHVRTSSSEEYDAVAKALEAGQRAVHLAAVPAPGDPT